MTPLATDAVSPREDGSVADRDVVDGCAPAPTLCILMPCFRDQAGLERTLAVLAQEEYPFDIVVVDDGSPVPITTPESAGTHRVRLARMAQNGGVPAALNLGLQIILDKGYDYMARLDCGDLPQLGRLRRQVAYLEDHPDVGIVGTWAHCVDDDDVPLFTLRFPVEDADIRRRQRYAPAMLISAVIIRMKAFEDAGPRFSTEDRYAEDFELFMRIGQSWRLHNIPEPLTTYIISATGLTARTGPINMRARVKVLRNHFDVRDPHAWLGIVRNLVWMQVPFHWGLAIKKTLWRT